MGRAHVAARLTIKFDFSWHRCRACTRIYAARAHRARVHGVPLKIIVDLARERTTLHERERETPTRQASRLDLYSTVKIKEESRRLRSQPSYCLSCFVACPWIRLFSTNCTHLCVYIRMYVFIDFFFNECSSVTCLLFLRSFKDIMW